MPKNKLFRFFHFGLLLIILTIITIFLAPIESLADTHYWNSTGSTAWGTGGNWVPAAVPASGDSVVFSGSSTVNCTLGANIDVGGFSVQSGYTGTINFNGYNVDCTGNFSWAGGEGSTLAAGIGTLTFDSGDPTWTPGSVSYNHVTLNIPNSGWGIAISGTADVDGNFTFTDGDLDTGTMTLSGSLTIGNSNDGGSATIILNGTGAQTITGGSATKMANLTINSSGTVTVSGNVNLGVRTLTVTNGTLNLNNNTLSVGAFSQSGGTFLGGSGNITTGNYSLSGGAFTATSGTLTVSSGSLTISGSPTFTHNSGEVAFTGTGDHPWTAGTLTYYNITMNKTGSGNYVLLNSAVVISNNFVLLANGFNANGNNMFVGGKWTQSGGTFTSGTNIVTFDGSGTQTINTGGTGTGNDFNSVKINGTGTVQLITNNMDIDGGLAVAAGTFDINDLTLTGTITSAGTTTITANANIMTGSGSYTINNLTNNGTLQLEGAGPQLTVSTWSNTSGSLVKYTGDSGDSTVTIKNTTYDDLEVNNAGTTFNLSADTTCNDALTISAGTLDAVNGSNYDLIVKGNWANSGTFTARSGSVTIRGTSQSDITGSSSFYDLIINTTTDGAKTVRFAASTIQTIVNSMILTGAATKTLTIQSTTAGTQGTLDIPSSISSGVDYVDVKDNQVNKADSNTITAGSNSTNSGNNTNWIFGSGTETVGGTAYTDDNEATALASKAAVVVVYDGSNKTSYSTTTNGSGVYSVTVGTLNDADIVLAYLDDETQEGCTVLRSNGSAVSNLNIYQNHTSIRSDSGSITNTNLSNVDDTDTDVKYSVSGSDLTVDAGFELFIASSSTFAPGGTITTQNTAGNANGDVDIRGTLNSAGNNLTCAGDWSNAGTYTSGTNTTTFNGSVGTITLNSGGTGESQNFNHITYSGTSVLQLNTNAIDIDGNLTISSGTFSANSLNITVAGSFTNSSTFTPGTNTITFDGTGSNATINPGASSISSLTISSGTVTILSNDLTVSGTFTNTSTGVMVEQSSGNGQILKAATSVKLTDSGGTESATFTTGNNIFIQLVDQDENLIGGASNDNNIGSFVITSSIDSETINSVTNSTMAPDEAATAATFLSPVGLAFNGTDTTNNNGTLGVAASETITVTYTDQEDSADNAATDTATATASTASTTTLIDSGGTSTTTYTYGNATTGKIYISVADTDENTSSSSAQTVTVTITNSANSDSESVTLTETGNNTAVFDNTATGLSFDARSTNSNNNSLLEISNSATVTASYTDDDDASDVTTDTATATVPASTTTFIDVNGTSVDTFIIGTPETGKVYIKVTDTDENQDANTAETITVTVTSTETNDSVTVTLTETGNNTGIFNNTSTGLSYDADDAVNTSNTTLETRHNSTITASYTDNDYSSDTSSDTATINAGTNLILANITATPTTVRIGDYIKFTATIKSRISNTLNSFSAMTDLPPGISFVAGSAKIDSAVVSDPTAKDPLDVSIASLTAGATQTITFNAIVGSGTPIGTQEAKFYAKINPVISNTSNITLTINPDPLFTLGTLIGKVFNDINENKKQDKGEEGIPNIKLATSEGIVVITDEYGRYHIPDIIPSRHLIKIDTNTLPLGSKLTTEKTVLFKSTDAMLNKANFGVKLPKDYNIQRPLKVPISVGVDQDYSPNLQRKLNIELIADGRGFNYTDGRGLISADIRGLEKTDSNLQSYLRLSSNYPDFISSWRLDIFKDADYREFVNTNSREYPPLKTIQETGAPNTQIDINSLNLSPGNYILVFSVLDDKGHKDTSEFTLSVEGVSSLNPEIPDALKSEISNLHSAIYNLKSQISNFNIPLRGSTIILQGETQPSNSLLINNYPVSINTDSSYQQDFILPPGVYDIPISVKDTKDNEENLSKDIRVTENYFFFVALADEEVGMFNIEGAIESLSQEDKDKLEKNLYEQGNIALYLKAKIKGKYLITSSFDNDRERKELFRNLEPEEYYPIYGDSSSIEYDAVDTQDELYLLVEADKSYFKWGSYGSGFTGTELSRYDRTLHGAKLHYETNKTLATAFSAQARQLASHDELRGTGGSLYYLKHKDIISGSEKIYIETRDELNNTTLSLQEMKEGEDYEIDYDQARIIFHNPVTSTSTSTNSTITSSTLLDGNPVYVIADYEYESSERMKDLTTGLRFSQELLKGIRVGTTLLEENRQTEDYQLRGSDVQITLPFNTTISSEFAATQRYQLRNFFSNDGGLTFTQVSNPQSGATGDGYTLNIDSQPFKNTVISSYYKRLDKDFSTTDTVNSAGTEKYGAKLSQSLTTHLGLNAIWDTQRLRDSGNELSDNLGANRLDTYTLQTVYQPNDKINLTSEFRKEDYKELTDPNKSDLIDYLAQQVGYQINPNLKIFTGYQTTLRGEDNNQIKGGLNLKVDSNTNLYLTETVGNQGDATTFGIERIQDQNTSYYTNYTLERQVQSSHSLTITLGGKSQITPRTNIYKEDQFNLYSGDPTYKNIFGLTSKLTDKTSIDFSYERAKTQNQTQDTTYQAGKLSLGYVDALKLKMSQDIEVRFDDASTNQRQLLGISSLEYQITKDLSHLSRLEYSLTTDTNTHKKTARFHEFQSGFAYRPIKFDWLNFLTEYKRTEDISPSSQSDNDNVIQKQEEEYAAELSLDILPPYLTVTPKFARRNRLQQISGQGLFPSETYLWANRLTYHLNQQWDIIGEYRILTQRQAKDSKDGLIIEIDRLLGDYLRIGAGYHFAKYDNAISPASNYEAKGFFMRFTTSLSDISPEELEQRRQKILESRKQRNIKTLINIKLRENNSAILNELNQILQQADKEKTQGNYQEAVILYTQVIHKTQELNLKSASLADYHIELEQEIKDKSLQAQGLYKEGRYLEAEKLWQEVIQQANRIKQGMD